MLENPARYPTTPPTKRRHDSRNGSAGNDRCLVRVKVWRTESQACTDVRTTMDNLKQRIDGLESSKDGHDPKKDKAVIKRIDKLIAEAEQAVVAAEARKAELHCR
ncbi:hypothetical protein SAMN04487914_13932 [Arthrobacter sp. ok909]|uniref:hypothetical protein n=1 Tax=Arthrobacter sp. ok909 TaxID=1761746 RepID=UPI00087FCCDB|nr:hypothetical protein [Arthrobacter sp. ok909]SDP78473.1 hypothetical protein SAMN04487914_13932 [Arthrobacter sp. ok909]